MNKNKTPNTTIIIKEKSLSVFWVYASGYDVRHIENAVAITIEDKHKQGAFIDENSPVLLRSFSSRIPPKFNLSGTPSNGIHAPSTQNLQSPDVITQL
jgi:hypothetical protein